MTGLRVVNGNGTSSTPHLQSVLHYSVTPGANVFGSSITCAPEKAVLKFFDFSILWPYTTRDFVKTRLYSVHVLDLFRSIFGIHLKRILGVKSFNLGVQNRPQNAVQVVANSNAVREWDSNGTNFGYRPELGHTAGEFGHNDFYAVPIAAAQLAGRSGRDALLGMVLLDEIRGRLAEVFSLKSYKIDHVVQGAIEAVCGRTRPGAVKGPLGASRNPWWKVRGLLARVRAAWRGRRRTTVGGSKWNVARRG